MGPERTDEILQKQDERDRVEEFKREVGPERVEEILQKQDERDRVTSCARGRGPPRTMPTPDDDPTAAALVSPYPGDTVSAPCRRGRPGPAALDRLRQWWGPAPARPKPVWPTD
jgi:hypothetical protein